MTHVPHELHEDFPDKVQQIHDLKVSNAHFQRLSEQYHELNRQIHRIETGVEPTAQDHETELRKRRVLLKDEIALMLASAG